MNRRSILCNVQYFRDLACRQNHNITEAQVHLYLSAKRYYKNDIEECIYQMKEGKQLDLNGKTADEQRDKLLTELEGLKTELENKIEELRCIKNLDFKKITDGSELEKDFDKKFIERLFIYHNRLILIDSEKNVLRLKYKSDLFDELIFEFRKLYEWLDFRASYLKFSDNEGSEHVIDKTEVKTIIHFFDKLNKIKRDDELY